MPHNEFLNLSSSWTLHTAFEIVYEIVHNSELFKENELLKKNELFKENENFLFKLIKHYLNLRNIEEMSIFETEEELDNVIKKIEAIKNELKNYIKRSTFMKKYDFKLEKVQEDNITEIIEKKILLLLIIYIKNYINNYLMNLSPKVYKIKIHELYLYINNIHITQDERIIFQDNPTKTFNNYLSLLNHIINSIYTKISKLSFKNIEEFYMIIFDYIDKNIIENVQNMQDFFHYSVEYSDVSTNDMIKYYNCLIKNKIINNIKKYINKFKCSSFINNIQLLLIFHNIYELISLNKIPSEITHFDTSQEIKNIIKVESYHTINKTDSFYTSLNIFHLLNELMNNYDELMKSKNIEDIHNLHELINFMFYSIKNDGSVFKIYYSDESKNTTEDKPLYYYIVELNLNFYILTSYFFLFDKSDNNKLQKKKQVILIKQQEILTKQRDEENLFSSSDEVLEDIETETTINDSIRGSQTYDEIIEDIETGTMIENDSLQTRRMLYKNLNSAYLFREKSNKKNIKGGGMYYNMKKDKKLLFDFNNNDYYYPKIFNKIKI